jgi:CHU_C Type IX secretion signal domain
MKLFRWFLWGLFLVVSLYQSAHATHLRAGEITVERVNCTSLTFKITITVYTNTGSEIRFGDGLLNFGDGSRAFQTPTIENTNRPDLGPNIGIVSYTLPLHTYPGPGRYVISYREANRNAGILNMYSSVDTEFYLETVITIDPFLGCDNSPKLLIAPIDKGCTGATWYHNPGAYDPDGDSLSYELTIPKMAKDQVVNNYRAPNVREFYDRIGLSYGTANEAKNGAPTFSINSRTGTITWDAPGAPGEYNIAFLIKEWRKAGGVWILLGSVTRDMQIIIEDCKNQRPELQLPADICVEAGTKIDEDIFGFDPDGDSVKIEAFSEVFSLNPSSAKYAPNPPIFQVSGPSKLAKVKFTWDTQCQHVKEQPYQVVFKVSDKRKTGQGPSLVEFKTWNIKVVGPAPEWNNIQVDQRAKTATVNWKPYKCQNAEKIEVWRRIDKMDFTPPECVTGMPESLGYTKITEVPVTQSTYRDTNNGRGLAPGAQYCYRLVAVFARPGGGESYVSQEICSTPLLADAPVVTNVTVDKTDDAAGQITVKWRSPFDLDKVLYPRPYNFEVYRAEGLSGEVKLAKAHAGQFTDSTFVDSGINTEIDPFNYRIIAYDKNGVKIDTSSTASSVLLEAKPQLQRIELTWSFDVPWSNNTQDYPRHRIYRGGANVTESQLVLIDSVDVNKLQFHYIDSGQYQDTRLKETETYCYRVMTRGAYGNPKIKEPLVNFSQIVCAQPNDNDPPCEPEIKAEGVSCDSYSQNNSCAPSSFSNILKWKRPIDPSCRADIRSYRVYLFSEKGAKDSILLAENVKDTFFIDTNIPSYARCYKVSAVDRAGNESTKGEMFCFDNCPYYELPNVFTPNGDNCNEVFSAYSDRIVTDELGNGPCGQVDLQEQQMRCARFVQKVQFTVVNRWGKEVYSYESGGERSIYIDWNGRDNDGKELTTGIYYYAAKVTFDVVDPAQREQTIRSWVHLIR